MDGFAAVWIDKWSGKSERGGEMMVRVGRCVGIFRRVFGEYCPLCLERGEKKAREGENGYVEW